jgi:hypothetical protein
MKAEVFYAVRIANENRTNTRSPSDEGYKVWAWLLAQAHEGRSARSSSARDLAQTLTGKRIPTFFSGAPGRRLAATVAPPCRVPRKWGAPFSTMLESLTRLTVTFVLTCIHLPGSWCGRPVLFFSWPFFQGLRSRVSRKILKFFFKCKFYLFFYFWVKFRQNL